MRTDQDDGRPMLFHAPDWTMRVEVDPAMDGGLHYHADMYRAGVWVCRVAIAGTFADRAAAEQALTQRMKQWLVDYESRPRTSGDAEFPI
jgi:hypothetical protein